MIPTSSGHSLAPSSEPRTKRQARVMVLHKSRRADTGCPFTFTVTVGTLGGLLACRAQPESQALMWGILEAVLSARVVPSKVLGFEPFWLGISPLAPANLEHCECSL